jgi:hypothetical protein
MTRCLPYSGSKAKIKYLEKTPIRLCGIETRIEAKIETRIETRI